MPFPIFEAKDVAHQMEHPDLSATIQEQPVTANGAPLYLIDMLGGVLFTKDFGFLAVFNLEQTENWVGGTIKAEITECAGLSSIRYAR
ncbi:hypothetical protein BJS_08570 [Bradyrhizobium japonicum SEMIA 5079]|nr:hypothetical protein BJS_08570 [Bradyrhizobium japonicum SEMIA 5079]